MINRSYDPFDDNCAHLKTLPDSFLRDIARNEAAERRYRKAAVEVLHSRQSVYLKHPDLQGLVSELEIELDGIQFEFPAPSGPEPLTAGVTTATMFADNPIENSAPKSSEAVDAKSQIPTESPK